MFFANHLPKVKSHFGLIIDLEVFSSERDHASGANQSHETFFYLPLTSYVVVMTTLI